MQHHCLHLRNNHLATYIVLGRQSFVGGSTDSVLLHCI